MRLRSIAPILPVADVEATVSWYARHLGFDAHTFPAEPPHDFAILVRDGVELMLQRVPGYTKPDLSALQPGGTWDAYVRVDGVEQLHEELTLAGVSPTPLVRTSHDDTEFELRDPDGHILVFAELLP